MKEKGEDRVMVPMKLNGLGSAQSIPETLVVLLTPVEENKYCLPTGDPMIFPIGVPAEMVPVYFAKITQHFTPNGAIPDLSHYYELMSETKLQTLHIYQGKSGARSYLVFKNKQGEENSFRVSLLNGILSALSHRLPILMEQTLLEAAASVVRINRTKSKETHAPLETIAKEIEAGVKPDNPLSPDIRRILDNLAVEDRAKLLQMAVAYENYEWAAVLKDLKIEDE